MVAAAKPGESNTSVAAMARLQSIGRHLVEAGHPLAPWFFRCLAEYQSGARLAGMTLDDAFGLTPGAGKDPWWRLEDRERRDVLLRGCARDFSPEVRSRLKQAELIVQKRDRFMATAVWPAHKGDKSLPQRYSGKLEERLFLILKTDPGFADLSADRISRILSG
jgi:hypothetical protein